MALIDQAVLTGMGVKAATAEKYLPRLNQVLPEHGIDTPLRVAHFLAQIVLESARFEAVVENLSYSGPRLWQVFKSHFSSEAEADQFAHQPEKIGNRVYANRLGNGNEASGDGYRYRGRGLIQLTGKANYASFRSFLDKQEPSKPDVVGDPDLVASTYAVDSAVFFWSMRNINALADLDDINAVTKAVNGSTRGVDARAALLAKAKALLDVKVPQLDAVTDFVKATTLNLRGGPSTAAAVVAALADGAPVDRVGGTAPVDADGFYWVQVKAVSGADIVQGFVAAQFLDPAPTLTSVTHVVSVSTVLRMRSEPTTSAAVVAELPDGTPVEATSTTPVSADGFDWLPIDVVLQGVLKQGYVAEQFLQAR